METRLESVEQNAGLRVAPTQQTKEQKSRRITNLKPWNGRGAVSSMDAFLLQTVLLICETIPNHHQWPSRRNTKLHSICLSSHLRGLREPFSRPHKNHEYGQDEF